MASEKQLPPELEAALKGSKYKSERGATDNAKCTPRQVMDLSQERAIYNEIMGPMLGGSGPTSRRNSNADAGVGSLLADYKHPGSNPVLGNSDFNSTILTRLQKVEAEAKELKRKYAEEIAKNQRLESELASMKAATTQEPAVMAKELDSQKELNAKLSMQLVDMELFLADYGLMWVGNSGNESAHDGPPAPHDDETEEGVTAEHPIFFDEFRKAIDELNGIIHDEPTQIVTEGDQRRKARFVKPSEQTATIVVQYYKNGLLVRRGPFRPCGSSGYNSFVKDVEDGYFPYEFHEEYPNGVLFDLRDKRQQIYTESTGDPDTQMSREQLLGRLPKSVIRGGQVIAVRSEVQSKLSTRERDSNNNNSNSNSNRTADVSNSIQITGASTKRPSHPLSGALVIVPPSEKLGTANVATVQIRWLDGATLLAHMNGSDPIDLLKQRISDSLCARLGNKDREGAMSDVSPLGVGDFELRTAYPPRALNGSLTLKEAGLVPNGTVHARRV